MDILISLACIVVIIAGIIYTVLMCIISPVLIAHVEFMKDFMSDEGIESLEDKKYQDHLTYGERYKNKIPD